MAFKKSAYKLPFVGHTSLIRGSSDTAVSYSAAMNLHLKILDAGNNHHMAEALFKAFGKALDLAVSEEPRISEVWSTKGSL